MEEKLSSLEAWSSGGDVIRCPFELFQGAKNFSSNFLIKQLSFEIKSLYLICPYLPNCKLLLLINAVCITIQGPLPNQSSSQNAIFIPLQTLKLAFKLDLDHRLLMVFYRLTPQVLLTCLVIQTPSLSYLAVITT